MISINIAPRLYRTFSNMSYIVKVGVLQLRCTSDKEKNFGVCQKLIKEASSSGAKMVFLPENFDFISENKKQSFELCESLNGNLINRYRDLARDNRIYISLGGFHRQGEGEHVVKGKMYNSHVVIDNSGVICAVYDKLHLFDVDIPNGVSLKESKVIQAGSGVVAPVDTPLGPLGLAICYDLRFSEMSQCLREMSAEVLTFPSSFTATTGEAHWHTLLRARAIETQCFVIAAAQEGSHNDKRRSYGHSIVYDPWGTVVAERVEPGEGLLLCDIDRRLITRYRGEMPVFSHRRGDIFPSLSGQGELLDIGDIDFKFGTIDIESSCIFYRTRLSCAFVNLSPLVPGHVLVSPLRVACRLRDLSPIEVTDLYSVVRIIAPKLAEHFVANGLTISQQDGEEAGQTVPHVHIHVLPRKKGDFPENDDIYKELQNHDKPCNTARKYRDMEEMNEEAAAFRKLFY